MSARRLGPAIGVVAVGYAALWLVARPAGQPAGRVMGELCVVARAFGGLDPVAVRHRRVAEAGIAGRS
jgi:hypothetical protein